MDAQAPTARNTSIICIGNQKGGVGKTSSSIHVATGLAEMGKLCLIVDLDSSAGATKAFGVPTEGWLDSYDMLTGAEEPQGCIIDNNDEEIRLPDRVHLIPASRKLEDLDSFLTKNKFVVLQEILVDPINQLRGKYDYIILDTPPNVKKTWPPALKASDFLILIAIPEDLAIRGLDDALVDFQDARRYANPKLELLGVIVSHVPKPKTRLARHLISYVTDTFQDATGSSLIFKSEISRTVAIGEAMASDETIFQYAPSHKVAEEYRLLVKEIDERIKARRLQPTLALPTPQVTTPQQPTTDSPKEVVNA